TAGGAAWKLGEVTTPALSPTGRSVVFAKDGQIYQNRVGDRLGTGTGQVGDRLGTGTGTSPLASPLIRAWGTNTNPRWSPDGSKLAFTGTRVDHSFIGIYDVRTKDLKFVSPSVDFDSSPSWSPDGKRIAFIRRPGTPFGLQAQQGTGSLGNPNGPAF